MISNKKGQGISINVIIIAAIGLLVLIILAVLVARSGTHVQESTECIKEGGLCKEDCDDEHQIGGDTATKNLCNNNQVGGVDLKCCSPIAIRDSDSGQ